MSVSFKVEGLRELEAQLVALKKLGAGREMKRAARKAFAPVRKAARQKAPKDTGLLRRRVRVRTAIEGTVVAAGLVLGSTPKTLKGRSGPPEVRNWSWYERGIPSRGIAARPFMRPALDENASAVVKLLRDELDSAVRRLVAKRATR